MNYLSFIFARGGSKGLKKNIKNINGKPLIAHTIEKALNCSFIDKVVVSTDSKEISELQKYLVQKFLIDLSNLQEINPLK